MKLKILFIAAILSLASVGSFGQKTLEKPYHTWSKEEAMKVLSSLPFADQYQSTNATVSAGLAQDARERADNSMAGSERGRSGRTLAPTPVIVRLHSALPIRQAMVRLQEIQANYDKMGAEDKKKFDEGVANFLECQICKNYYVVTMVKFKNSTMGVVDDGLFQTMKLEDLKNNVWLINDKGERRELEQFTPAKGPGDFSIFFFRRPDEKGNSFLTPENKEFKLAFSTQFRSGNNNYGYLVPSSFEFKIAKILIDGQVAF